MPFALLVYALLASQPTPGELTLEVALKLADRAASDLIQVRADLLLIDTDRMLAYSQIMPRADLNLGAGEFFAGKPIAEFRSRDFAGSVQGPFRDFQTASYSNPNFTLNLTARQLLLDGGRWWTVIAQTDDVEKQRRAAVEQIRNEVRFRVTQAFYNVLKLQRAVEVRTLQCEVDQAQVDRANALMRVGRGARAAVATAVRTLAEDRIALRREQLEHARAMQGLNFELGRSLAPMQILVTPEHVATSTITRDDFALPSLRILAEHAVSLHPEVAQLEAQIDAQKKEVRIQQSEYWPKLFLQANYRRQSRRPSRIFGNPAENYFAGIDFLLQWNMFAGRSTEASVQVARINLDKLNARRNDLVRRTEGNVQNAINGLDAQLDVWTLAGAGVKAAKEAVLLSRALFDKGRATSLELRDAELKFTQAQLQAISARLDIEIAWAEVLRSVGGVLPGREED